MLGKISGGTPVILRRLTCAGSSFRMKVNSSLTPKETAGGDVSRKAWSNCGSGFPLGSSQKWGDFRGILLFEDFLELSHDDSQALSGTNICVRGTWSLGGSKGLQNELILLSSWLGQIPLSFQSFDYMTQTLTQVWVKRPHEVASNCHNSSKILRTTVPTVCAIKYLFENVKIRPTEHLWAIDIIQTLFSSYYIF